jgi:hypothetical protein
VGIRSFYPFFSSDCVLGHYHAYADAQVLHRDLSENNLMFKQGEGSAITGILNDWDMASYVEDNDEIKLSTATHRTGTIPFMARDLLVDTPPPHLYRHDLESFFYILVWAALHYDFASKERLPTLPLMQRWDDNALDIALDSKYRFITDDLKRDQVFLYVRPECQALLPWMTSLWTLFQDGQWALQRNRNKPGWNHRTLGGHLTFETYMQALGRTPRAPPQ